MPTDRPRVQVTLDSELAAALDEIDPDPPSRAGLIRDLALRGAHTENERRARQGAVDYLVSVVDGEVDLDFDASRAAWEAREGGL